MEQEVLDMLRSKWIIEEAVMSWPPTGPKLASSQCNPSSLLCAYQEGAAAKDATTVEKTVAGSNAGNCVIAKHTPQHTEEGAELPVPGEGGGDGHGAKTKPPLQNPKGNGKCKEKVIDTDVDAMDGMLDNTVSLPSRPRPFPVYPGYLRNSEENFFHMVPETHGGPCKKRAIFLSWPRDPNGKPLAQTEQPRGTLSPDGLPWRATLYDFYHVNRLIKTPNAVSTMTGSAIWELMRELGELDTASREIEWAKSEGKPRVEGVANTQMLIQCMEMRVLVGLYLEFPMPDDVPRTALLFGTNKEDAIERISEAGEGERHDEQHNKVDAVKLAPEDDRGDWGHTVEGGHDEDEVGHKSQIEHDDVGEDPVSILPPSAMPISSPFHPSHYPKPWPFIPFETPLSVLLQERIPLYLLPQTLHVHDPFALLSARKQTFGDTSWKSRPDIIRTYSLELSRFAHREVKEARRKAEELEEFKAHTLIVLRYKRTKEQIENHEPVIEVPLPPNSRRMTKVEDGHLYLSPVAKVGEGHHSIVYKGEWELPRDLFVRPDLCRKCFEESVDKEIQRLKDTGRWKKMSRAVSWSPPSFAGRELTQTELDELNDPTNLAWGREIVEREITCIVSPTMPVSQISTMIDTSDIWCSLMKLRRMNAVQLNLTQDSDEDEDEAKGSPVPTIRINPPLSYGTQKTCTHGWHHVAVPRTARFTVVAKLSIEDDYHLPKEASNYQQFPERFFRHYNGYTIIRQLCTIVPVHAVVPQFYGYYTPEFDEQETEEEEPYLSPILLLEYCGEPIKPEKLSAEDQEECASLLLRFHHAGWLHESVAPRNFLVQSGKPTEFPFQRQLYPKPSFRLIDFGRSRELERAWERRSEERQARRMFKKLKGETDVGTL